MYIVCFHNFHRGTPPNNMYHSETSFFLYSCAKKTLSQFLSSSVEPILQLYDFVFADHNSQLRKSMKANGHSVFEEIGEFVDAVDIYRILSIGTEEQVWIQLLFQIIQGLVDGYRITIT